MNNIFLASSLCMVDDVIHRYIDLKGKKVACIRNAAKERWWREAWRNKRDMEFFENAGAVTIDIDLEDNIDRAHIRDSVDILFVWWWDTLYLRDLSEQSGLHTSIHDFLQQWWIYMGTSAWSMLACHEVYYPHDGRKTDGLWLFPLCIIPHRWSPIFLEDRENNMQKMNDHGQSYIMLTDIDVIIIDNNTWSVQRSQKHTLEEVYKKVNEMD